MKVRVRHREHGWLEYYVDGNPSLELPLRGGDRDVPARVWLAEVERIEVSEHPEPAVMGPTEPARYEEKEFDASVYGWADGEKVRVGPKRTFTTRVHVPPRPEPAKKKRAAGA